MSISKERFTRGIILKADDIGVDGIEGELKVGATSKKLHAYLDGALRNVVTETQSQTLTNKTVVVANNIITTAASGNLVATELNAALAELQGDIDTINNTSLPPKVSGPAGATDDAIARFDGSTGKLVQNSPVTLSDTATLTPTSLNGDLNLQGNSLGKVNINGGAGLQVMGRTNTPIKSIIPDTPSNLTVTIGKHFRIGDVTVGPIDTITPILGVSESVSNGMEITLHKIGSNPLVINNMTGSPSYLGIKTGTGLPITIRPGDALHLVYNGNEFCWQVIGSQFKSTTISVDNTLVRFDGTTGHLVQESSVVLNDAEEMSGLTKLTVDSVVIDGTSVATGGSNDLVLNAGNDIVLEKNTHSKGTTRFEATFDSTTTGANATIPQFSTKHIQLSNVGLTSIDMIQNPGGAQEIILENMLTTPITINNNTGSTSSWRILTGTGGAIKLAPGSSLQLVHDFNMWRVVGGTGGSTTITKLAGETIAVNDLVYISTGTGADSGRFTGYVYKVDPTNDDRIEVIGFAASAAVLHGSIDVTVDGVVDTFSSLSYGKMYFADPTTPGAITTTPPSVGGQWAISVGVAVSNTELIVNQCASATAQYIQESDISFTIANNQSVAANVTDLLLDGGVNRSFIIDYTIYRKTDTALSAVAQAGQLRGVYNTQTGTWFIGDDYVGQNSGVDFSITVGGQIQYTSSNIAGTNYSGTLKYNVRKTFEV